MQNSPPIACNIVCTRPCQLSSLRDIVSQHKLPQQRHDESSLQHKPSPAPQPTPLWWWLWWPPWQREESAAVLVRLDQIGEQLCRSADEETRARCATVLQHLHGVDDTHASMLLDVLKARFGAACAAQSSGAGRAGEEVTHRVVDPLAHFLHEQPGCKFLNHTGSAHSTWSIGDRAQAQHVPQ